MYWSPYSDACTQRGGHCLDTNKYSCTNIFNFGLCSNDPDYIKCCFGDFGKKPSPGQATTVTG